MSHSLEAYLVLSVLLFGIGVFGFLAKRNAIAMLMSIEIMLNAGGLAFVAAGALHGSVDGQAMFLFILPVAAAEVAVGLAIAVLIHQRYKTLDLWALARAREE